MRLHKGGSLFGDLLLYYGLVLAQRLLDLLVGQLALLNLNLALVFECVDLLQQHLLAGLLLFVDLRRAQGLSNLVLNLEELLLALLHDFSGHGLVVVLQFAN